MTALTEDGVNIMFNTMSEVAYETKKMVEEKTIQLFKGVMDLPETLCTMVKEIKVVPALQTGALQEK